MQSRYYASSILPQIEEDATIKDKDKSDFSLPKNKTEVILITRRRQH